MDNPIIALSPTDTFKFHCSQKVACFNDCCRDLNQYLTPYDILRLKQHLNLNSSEFLERYTRTHHGPETGLPVITLKAYPASGFQCPFVEPDGCRVYPDRPSSCRMYPLARTLARSRETGRISEQYYLIQEPHCRGFQDGPSWTVKQWLNDQQVHIYNEMNDLMMEIISLKNSSKPGPLDPKSAHLFHLICYDTDKFRIQVLEKGLLDKENLDDATRKAIETDETALLKLGLAWLKKSLFE